MKYAIGIDTGGTCTDAVLYDFDTGKVLCSNKALTTYDDLTRGILEALDGLDASLCRQACAAGLSTTLATNACVENKGARAKLLMIGFDTKMMEHLKDIYASLNLKEFFDKVCKGRKITYDPNLINMALVMLRILDPGSKLYSQSKLSSLYGDVCFPYQHIPRFMDILEDNYDDYLSFLFDSSVDFAPTGRPFR